MPVQEIPIAAVVVVIAGTELYIVQTERFPVFRRRRHLRRASTQGKKKKETTLTRGSRHIARSDWKNSGKRAPWETFRVRFRLTRTYLHFDWRFELCVGGAG